MDARHAIHRARMGAQLLVGPVVRALGEEVEVEIGEDQLAHLLPTGSRATRQGDGPNMEPSGAGRRRRQSARSASVGSIRSARRAGTYDARHAIPTTSSETVAKLAGSAGLTP